MLGNLSEYFKQFYYNFTEAFSVPDELKNINTYPLISKIDQNSHELLDNAIKHIDNILDTINFSELDFTKKIDIKNNIEKCNFPIELEGNYYVYYIESKGYSLVRNKAKFFVKQHKLHFKYENARLHHNILNVKILGDYIYITLQYANNHNREKLIVFFINNLTFGKVLVAQYLTISYLQNVPISGLEVYVKQDGKTYEELKSKILHNYNAIGTEERIIWNFCNLQSLKPIFVKENLISINDISQFLHNQNRQATPQNIKNNEILIKNNWWLYYFQKDLNFVCRAVINFKADNKVTINNINYSSDTKSYAGSYSWIDDTLILNLTNENKNKNLNILIKTSRGNFSLIVGLWHNLATTGALNGGTIILEKAKQNTKMQPEIFLNNTRFKNAVHKSIRIFFQQKTLNSISTSSQISSYNDLDNFIKSNQEKTKKNDRIFNNTDILIISPILSINEDKFWTLKNVVTKIKTIISGKNNELNIFYAGDLIKNSEDYNKKIINFFSKNELLEKLDNSSTLIAIIPEKDKMGIFVEIGYLIKSGVPTIIFAPNEDILPFVLKEISKLKQYNLKIEYFNNDYTYIENYFDVIDAAKFNKKSLRLY